MPAPRDLLLDIVRISRRARSPNRGWQEMVQVAGARVGDAAMGELGSLDLADDAIDLRGILHTLRHGDPIPRAVDTLLFSLLPTGDALRVAGVRGFQASDADTVGNLRWQPQNGTVTLEALSALGRAARKIRARDLRAVIGHTLVLGAAALISRFAAAGLRFRIAVGFEGGEVAEIAPPRRKG